MIDSRKTIGCQIEILHYLTSYLLGYLMDTQVIFVHPGRVCVPITEGLSQFAQSYIN